MKSIFFLVALISSSLTFSQAPPNNDPTAAQELTLGQNVCGTFTQGTLVGATNSGKGETVCKVGVKSDVWYTMTVPNSGMFGIDASVDYNSPLQLSVDIYTGTADNLRFKACFYGEPDEKKLKYFLNDADLVPGEKLFIRIWDLNGKQGPFEICTWSLPNPPKNETPSTAETLSVGKFRCSSKVKGNLYNATDSGLGFTGCERGREPITITADVWYKVTVPKSGKISVELNNKESKNVVLSYWKGSASSLGIRGCTSVGYDLRVDLTKADEIKPGETLFIRVSNYDYTRVRFTICAFETR